MKLIITDRCLSATYNCTVSAKKNSPSFERLYRFSLLGDRLRSFCSCYRKQHRHRSVI